MLQCVKKNIAVQHERSMAPDPRGRPLDYTALQQIRIVDSPYGMPIQIKKYGNRRLYNTAASRYVNLEELAGIIRTGELVEVVDAATGQDITRAVLLQLILEVGGGDALMPVGMLHRVVRAMGEHPAQKMLLQQMSSALNLLDAQFVALENQFPWLKAPIPTTGPAAGPAPTQAPEPPPEAEEPEPAAAASAEEDSLAALRARLANLEARLKK